MDTWDREPFLKSLFYEQAGSRTSWLKALFVNLVNLVNCGLVGQHGAKL